ncbi:hypothetical protein PDE_01705 [Penicillium oxalicum 114-2]|uniref:Methylated-DNA--protein-cysteine methyltransferase n=1 Tax=Penicillium oxalicum (strain 114-2 / CGMCC 5302) TaxID=933388 RepID=S7ZDK0_PENO1|nr:hypothetical protein PDE_01705 [Penicillium oxalicum 114-2]
MSTKTSSPPIHSLPPPSNPEIPPTLQKQLRRISLHPTLTPYRRRVYRVLLSVPPGRWTTYSALATYLGSSARAVGNAMRRNPFAPEVPCHRVLAANGSLGGYKGEWSVSGHVAGGGFQEEKRVRLEREGVEFDAEGKVMGVCFGEFRDWAEVVSR